MRMTSLKCALGLASVFVVVASSAHATVGECRRTILAEYLSYTKSTAREVQQCEDKIVRGTLPVGFDCQPAGSHQNHFRSHVRSACGGKNKTCNAGDTGLNADVPLAAIGWDIGVCPGFEGSGCTNPITNCNDIGDCIFCIADAARSQAMGLYYDAFNVSPSNKSLRQCQQEIGKRSVDFYRKKLNALEKCERKVESGDISGPCPDPATQQFIAKQQAKVHSQICAKCGGSDKACGGTADLTTTEIGFTPTCPNVTIPGGAACGGAIATVDDIATCTGCVTEFKIDCLDALSSPELKTYPPECNVAP